MGIFGRMLLIDIVRDYSSVMSNAQFDLGVGRLTFFDDASSSWGL